MTEEMMKEALQTAQNHIAYLDHQLGVLLSQPVVHATVVYSKNEIDPKQFCGNDLVGLVNDPKQRTGRIVGKEGKPSADKDGYVNVIFPNMTSGRYRIGIDNTEPQVKLLGKNDGTNVTIAHDGNTLEVHGVFGHTFKPGDQIKVNIQTKQIIEVDGGLVGAGDVAFVKSVLDDRHLEVTSNGSPRIILNGQPDKKIEAGDRIQLDKGHQIAVRHLGRDHDEQYKCLDNINVPWSAIGGAHTAKEILKEIVELPFEFPEAFKAYNRPIPKGGLLYGPPGCGKAQPHSSIVFTPYGPMTMGEVLPGQVVCTPDGKSAKVLQIFPQGVVDIYRMFFNDGTFADCTLDHLWQVEGQCGYKSGAFTTEQLIGRLRAKDGKRLYSIPMTEPVEFVGQDHLIHPYLMGILISEGNLGISTASVTICEREIYDRVVAVLPAGYRLNYKNDPERPCDYYVSREKGDQEHDAVVTQELRRLGLRGTKAETKFIPAEYLYDSLENRLELIRGLMDGDGTVSKTAHVSYSTSSPKLSEDVRLLIESLGGTCVITSKRTWYTYKNRRLKGKKSYLCNIAHESPERLMTLGYKVERVKTRTKYWPKRMIDRIEYVRQEEAQCILVDHPDHLYLTDHFVVTHNTMIAKAAYTSLCDRFGKAAMGSGWIYVKGPELLSMYVGIAEQNVREVFYRARKHFERHKVPAFVFIDEADAILMRRGSSRSSDVDKTIVPMFLSEMDGLEESHAVILLATNRQDSLDPAVVRPGRIDRHVKVPRPDMAATSEIMRIHLKGVPLKDTTADTVAAITTADLFSKQWTMYKLTTQMVQGLNTDLIVTLKDCLNGAMIANVVDQAVTGALKRDIKTKKISGVKLEDFREAVKSVYKGQQDQNHEFDLDDFMDENKLSKCACQVEKLKA